MDSITEIYEEIAHSENDYDLVPERRKESPRELRHKSVQNKAKTYAQYLISGYEPSFRWTNETLDKDRRLLYMKANELIKKKSDSSLKSILDWSKKRNLHVKQVIKVITRAI